MHTESMQMNSIFTWSLPLRGCVVLSGSLNISAPQFAHLLNGDNRTCPDLPWQQLGPSKEKCSLNNFYGTIWVREVPQMILIFLLCKVAKVRLFLELSLGQRDLGFKDQDPVLSSRGQKPDRQGDSDSRVRHSLSWGTSELSETFSSRGQHS